MKLGILILVGAVAFAAASAMAASSDIEVKIDSVTNVSGNGSMEVCGKAVHKSGIKPLLVTILHDESSYSTLTAGDGRWCAVIKRWTYDGRISVGATTLTSVQVPEKFETAISPNFSRSKSAQ